MGTFLQLIFKWWILQFVCVPVTDKFRPLARLPDNSAGRVKAAMSWTIVIIIIIMF